MGWAAGLNNLITDTSTPHTGKGFIALGFNNEVRPGTSENYIVAIGNANEGYGANNFIFGRSNVGSSNMVMAGFGLKKITSGGTNNNACLYGTYNNTSSGLNGTVVAIGVGTSNLDRKNAMVMSKDVVKVINDLELRSDHTQVNAITPYVDPDNPTADDQTLVTKSYRRNLPVQLTNDLVNNQSTSIANGATINLETGFSITFPTWTELIKIGITNSGGYMDYITMAADVNKSYLSVTGAGTVDEFSYNASTKDFTFVSGGTSASILSIRAEGKTTI